MAILRCFECDGLKYNSRGNPCPICGGTGFITVVTREENANFNRRATDRRKKDRRKSDRRKNGSRFFEEKQPLNK